MAVGLSPRGTTSNSRIFCSVAHYLTAGQILASPLDLGRFGWLSPPSFAKMLSFGIQIMNLLFPCLRRFAPVLILLGLFTPNSMSADSYLLKYPSQSRIYSYDGEFLCNYPSGTRLYAWDGQYILKYPSQSRLYSFDGEYLCQYPSGSRLFQWDAPYITTYPGMQRLYAYDGEYITRYPSGERIFEVSGVIPIPILMALITGLL